METIRIIIENMVVNNYAQVNSNDANVDRNTPNSDYPQRTALQKAWSLLENLLKAKEIVELGQGVWNAMRWIWKRFLLPFAISILACCGESHSSASYSETRVAIQKMNGTGGKPLAELKAKHKEEACDSMVEEKTVTETKIKLTKYFSRKQKKGGK